MIPMKRLFPIALLFVTTAVGASTKESRTAGQATYAGAGCAQCHGANWAGTDNGPDLRTVGKDMPRESIQHQIVHGGGGMPPFADALNDAQLSQLVDFLEAQKKGPKKSRSKGTAAPKPPAETPVKNAGDAGQ